MSWGNGSRRYCERMTTSGVSGAAASWRAETGAAAAESATVASRVALALRKSAAAVTGRPDYMASRPGEGCDKTVKARRARRKRRSRCFSGQFVTFAAFGRFVVAGSGYWAKQYSRPAPPVATRFAAEHPCDACAEFHGEPGVPRARRS